MEQSWFEMNDLKKLKLNSRVWVPLRSIKSVGNGIDYGFCGYKEEFFGHASIAVPVNLKKEAFNHDWMDVSINTYHRGKELDEGYPLVFASR